MIDVEYKHSKTLVPYPEAIQIMDEAVAGIIDKSLRECIWFLEHDHVYTAGTSSTSADLLENDALPIFYSGRGGKFTYHGPGQRVIYLMLDLKKRFAGNEPDLKKYIFSLENLVIDTLAELGVRGSRKPGNIGVWVGDEKIASIGVRVKKWVAYHGISININTDLSHFKGIVPCGIHNCSVTSLKALGVSLNDLTIFDNAFKSKLDTFFTSMQST